MTTASPENLSRDYARLMLMMRRMIREEFAVTVHLDETEAGEELLAFAERSKNPMLKEMAIELEPMLNESKEDTERVAEPTASDTEVTYYRGVPVQRASSEDGDEPTASAGLATRIYRGQKIE